MPSAVSATTTETIGKARKKDESKREDKDRSAKKSSKKRLREDEAATIWSQEDRENSPSKRARTSPSVEEVTKASRQSVKREWLSRAADLNGDRTLLHDQTASLHLPISPISLRYPLKGLCAEHLSRLLLTYYPPVDGIILAYRNVKLSTDPPRAGGDRQAQQGDGQPLALAEQIDEYASSYIWLTATFLVLRPRKGVWMDAVVNIQNESHLGLIVWNLFPASIPKERLPKEWRWRDATPGTMRPHIKNGGEEVDDDEHGYFVYGKGKRLPQQISFRLRDFDASPVTEGDRGFVSLEGTLLSEEEDERLDKEEQEKAEKSRESTLAMRRRRSSMAGAGSQDLSGGQQVDDSQGGRHRSNY